jgi:AcrR family transcriptional regulator
VQTMTTDRPTRRRADASRNRERIVAAARDVFVELGPEAPLDEIARRAGVGNATVYRNFADRYELLRSVTLSVMETAVQRGTAALAEETDAFRALERFAHEAADERVGAQCGLMSCGLDPKSDGELSAARDRLAQVVERLLDNARSAGQLRPDVGIGDLMVVLSQLTRPLPGRPRIVIDQFVHRHLQLYLDGMRAPARSVLPGYAARLADLRRES